MEENQSHVEQDHAEPPDQGDDLPRRNRELQDEARRLRDRCAEIVGSMARVGTFHGADGEYRRAALNLLEDAEQARRAREGEFAERQRAEEARLRGAAANAFRLAFSDALRPLGNVAQIQSTATCLLRRHLNSSRVAYGEFTPDGEVRVLTSDYQGDIPPLPLQIPIGFYGPTALASLRSGEPVVVDDLERHASYAAVESLWRSILAAAYLAVPVLENGKLVATLVATHSTPRAWMSEEIAIVTETAGRIWDAVGRARVQQALRESEEHQRIALEAAGMGAWNLDVQSGQLIWNAQHFRLLGLEPEGHRDWSVADYLRHIHPDDREAVCEWKGTVSEFEGNTIDYRIVRPDGEVRWMSGFGQAVAKLDGRRARVSGVTFDTTERRESEALLAATQERLRLVVDSALEHAIISLDLERRVTSWNVGAKRIIGYRADEIVGRSLDVIFLPDARAAGLPEKEVEQALVEGRAGGSSWLVRKGGSLFWAECALMPIRARTGGEVVGFVKILTDETEMKEARESLERSREELILALESTEHARAEAETASLAKDHFLAVLSHELRTPLTPIVMALNALARRKDLPEQVRTAHEMIERNVQLEAHFIDDMLDVTRIARGKMEITRVDMDLHDAAWRAVEVSSPDLEAKGQVLTVSLEASEYRLYGDFARLQQAMWNVLKNASKFTPKGGAIGLRSRNVPGRIVVEIIDSGIGMEAEVVNRIFNPFEQADASITKQFGGLGLGLAIAKATVEAHGGELRADSAGPGLGATFTLSLPLAAKSG